MTIYPKMIYTNLVAVPLGENWREIAPTKRELFNMIIKCDINYSGSLDLAQFLLLFEERFRMEDKDRYREIFDLADTEARGTLRRTDVKLLVKSLNMTKVYYYYGFDYIVESPNELSE